MLSTDTPGSDSLTASSRIELKGGGGGSASITANQLRLSRPLTAKDDIDTPQPPRLRKRPKLAVIPHKAVPTPSPAQDRIDSSAQRLLNDQTLDPPRIFSGLVRRPVVHHLHGEDAAEKGVEWEGDKGRAHVDRRIGQVGRSEEFIDEREVLKGFRVEFWEEAGEGQSGEWQRWLR